MSDSPDPIQCGESLTYTITVNNSGLYSAEGVTVRAQLPSGANFISATSTHGSCTGTGLVTCGVGTLANGESAIITLVIAPTTGDVLVGTAGVGLNTHDPNLDNNSSTGTTGVDGYSIAPSGSYYFQGGDEGGVNVTAPTGCNWTATSNETWIQITSSDSGSGNGVVNYVVRDNFTGFPRQGTMIIAGRIFTVTQDGGAVDDCLYSISPTSTSFLASGGDGNISVFTEERCSWQSTSDVSWVTITSNCCGIGNGGITYSVAANTTGVGRAGKITIAGKVFTIKQKAN